jgi:signal transduction histidine kinase
MMRTDVNEQAGPPAALLFVGSVTLVLILALAVFYGLAQPPTQDLLVLALILSVAAVVSIGLGHGASRFGWIHRSPRLRWTLIAGNALTLGLVFLSVWVTAQLMFVNAHDLALATVLLIFAAGIATSLEYFLSTSLTQRITALNRAAQEIAEGNLDARAPVTGRDELAELAQAFNRMAAQLETAEEQQRKLEGLRRELVTWVGHDLRTPVTSIRVVVEALADGVVEDPVTVERYLQTAQHHIRSLSQLLDDLFDVVQIDAEGMRLERSRTSVRDLISDALESFSALAARERVKLEGSTEPGMAPVNVDVPKIERVLVNLLHNAIRHTPEDGVVHVSGEPAANGVRIEVRDTGEGIAADELRHVFKRFHRVGKERYRSGNGAGLGLAIAKGIVEAHGGDIGIESTVGEGTTVWFTLPRQEDGAR